MMYDEGEFTDSKGVRIEQKKELPVLEERNYGVLPRPSISAITSHL